MKELDLLKKDWQKNEGSFEQLSEKDIYAMIHKKSSSIVKWILIVSILEFVVLNGIGLLLPDDHSHEFTDKYDFYLEIFTYINYIITFYFVFLFYKNYKSISIITSTKELAGNILRTRKTVKSYIWFNIIYISLFILSVIIYTIFNSGKYHGSQGEIISIIVISIFILTLFIGLVWGFYQLIYGFLLKKLKRNYEELQKIES